MMKAFVRVHKSSCNDEITAFMYSVICYNAHRCNLLCYESRSK